MSRISLPGNWVSWIFLSLLSAAALWVALLPFHEGVQRAYLKRFHLQTESYPSWAVQQLTPAMYNLENSFWFCERPLLKRERNTAMQSFSQRGTQPLASPEQPSIEVDLLNHFPTRTMTFLNARAFLKQRETGGFYYFRTRYRQQQLETVYEVLPLEPGQEIKVIFCEANFD